MAVSVYGKAPVRGDFIDRRAPPDFAAAWHAWCASGLAAAKERFGEEFPQRYSRAPLWRYALAAGVCGDTPAVGVISPSADSVGRFFPLTIFSCANEPFSPLDILADNAAWFDRAEQLALDMFGASPELERFYDALDEMDAPRLAGEGALDTGGVVFAAAASGLAGLVSRTAGGKPSAAFWSVDGFSTDDGAVGALLLREGMPENDDWAVLLGVQNATER